MPGQMIRHDNPPIFDAIRMGEVEAVRVYLEQGGDPNLQNRYCLSLLSRAIQYDHVSIVSILISAGANINATNPHGETPLREAVGQGATNIVRLLVEQGADCNRCDNNGRSPLFWARLPRGQESEKDWSGIEQLLLLNGARVGFFEVLPTDDIHAIEEMLLSEEKPSQEMKEQALRWAAEWGHVGTVKLLLDNGVDINAYIKRGNTALVRAIDYEQVDVVRLLVEQGAELNSKVEDFDCINWTPLMRAGAAGATEIVEILLKAGADPNLFSDKVPHSDYETENALMCTSFYGHVEAVRLLLRYGANVAAKNTAGKTAIDALKQHMKHFENRYRSLDEERNPRLEILALLEAQQVSQS